jgi:hypothetical protein
MGTWQVAGSDLTILADVKYDGSLGEAFTDLGWGNLRDPSPKFV